METSLSHKHSLRDREAGASGAVHPQAEPGDELKSIQQPRRLSRICPAAQITIHCGHVYPLRQDDAISVRMHTFLSYPESRVYLGISQISPLSPVYSGKFPSNNKLFHSTNMPIASLKSPLMSAMLSVIYEHGQTESYDSDWITEQIRETGFWEHSTADTPVRTVNKNFSQSLDVFDRVRPNTYRLRPEYFRLADANKTPTNPDSGVSTNDGTDAEQDLFSSSISVTTRIEQTVFRTLRDTKMVRQLKLLHDNKCQICRTTIEIGDKVYSEGHHIQPLGLGGPDMASNIVILCPNHHVQCDYGGIPLDVRKLRTDSRHRVSTTYTGWHNNHYGFDTVE